MTINEYQAHALRTESRTTVDPIPYIRVLEDLMGLNGETDEAIDLMKKVLFQRIRMSDYGIKETQCTRCSHREICSLKGEFLAAQEAINEAVLHHERKKDEAVSMIRIRDIKYIEPVELRCKHYAIPTGAIR